MDLLSIASMKKWDCFTEGWRKRHLVFFGLLMSLHLGIPCGQRQCTQRGLDSAGGDGHRGNIQNEDLAIEFGNLKLISAGTSKCQ